LCTRRKIPYLPGCATATEVSAAEELGCEIAKIFPGGEVGGPAFVKALRGPCPWVSIMPTDGVDTSESSLKAWFDAGVACVGIGGSLITKELLANKDYEGITRNIAKTLALIAKIRAK
jgi:2-dehydro-3-deoxyphosphogluconate aldolase / (4S)-4-hydroxy-2-oxoglutarate aldolase